MAYDAEGNIVQAVSNTTASIPVVTSPLTNAAVQPAVDPQGVSNQPLNAATTIKSNVQIGASTGSTLASWSNPA